MGHDCTGYNCIGHNCIGHNHTGHNYMGRDSRYRCNLALQSAAQAWHGHGTNPLWQALGTQGAVAAQRDKVAVARTTKVTTIRAKTIWAITICVCECYEGAVTVAALCTLCNGCAGHCEGTCTGWFHFEGVTVPSFTRYSSVAGAV